MENFNDGKYISDEKLMEKHNDIIPASQIHSLKLRGRIWDYHHELPLHIRSIFRGETKTEDLPFERYLTPLQFDIIGYDEECSSSQKIGYIKGKYFDIEKAEEDDYDNILGLYDALCQLAIDAFELVSEGESIEPSCVSSNFFTIEYIYISPEYRRRNIATAAMLLLTEAMDVQFNRMIGNCLVSPFCIPLTTQENFELGYTEEDSQEDIEKKDNRWEKFFSRLGFQWADKQFMFFNCDYDMAKIYLKNTKPVLQVICNKPK